jgi:peptidoglycan hydrolase-like protein with peptidoglycan-binding domain
MESANQINANGITMKGTRRPLIAANKNGAAQLQPGREYPNIKGPTTEMPIESLMELEPVLLEIHLSNLKGKDKEIFMEKYQVLGTQMKTAALTQMLGKYPEVAQQQTMQSGGATLDPWGNPTLQGFYSAPQESLNRSPIPTLKQDASQFYDPQAIQGRIDDLTNQILSSKVPITNAESENYDKQIKSLSVRPFDKNEREKKMGGKAGLSKAKAAEMLHDGTVHGKPITEKQRRFFAATAYGKKKMQDGGTVPEISQSEYTTKSKTKSIRPDTSGRSVLKRGDRDTAGGGEITLMQTFLANNGFYTGKPDGIYGPKTEAAVRKYQKYFNDNADEQMFYQEGTNVAPIGKGGKKIKEDGVVGDQTRTALMYREKTKPAAKKTQEWPDNIEFPLGESLVKYQTSDKTPNNFPDSPMNYAGGLEMLALGMIVPEMAGTAATVGTASVGAAGVRAAANLGKSGLKNIPTQVNRIVPNIPKAVGRQGSRSFAPKTPSAYGTRIGYQTGGETKGWKYEAPPTEGFVLAGIESNRPTNNVKDLPPQGSARATAAGRRRPSASPKFQDESTPEEEAFWARQRMKNDEYAPVEEFETDQQASVRLMRGLPYSPSDLPHPSGYTQFTQGAENVTKALDKELRENYPYLGLRYPLWLDESRPAQKAPQVSNTTRAIAAVSADPVWGQVTPKPPARQTPASSNDLGVRWGNEPNFGDESNEIEEVKTYSNGDRMIRQKSQTGIGYDFYLYSVKGGAYGWIKPDSPLIRAERLKILKSRL